MLPSTLMRPLVCFVLLISLPARLRLGTRRTQPRRPNRRIQLTPAARARVLEILGPGNTMASVASWADEVRRARPETGPWHYIDIPLDKPRLDMERDCAKGDCIVSAISRFRQVLRDPATPAEQRTEALMFLIHFVGDMHQPLHSSDNHDRGGNGVQVQFHDRPTNLHSFWDSGLLGRLAGGGRALPELSREVGKAPEEWSKGTVTDWAEQSHKVGRKFVYRQTAANAPKEHR